MTPEIEREYRALIEDAEAHFAAAVRWSEDGRLVTDGEDRPPTFAQRWLIRLAQLRAREASEYRHERVMHA